VGESESEMMTTMMKICEWGRKYLFCTSKAEIERERRKKKKATEMRIYALASEIPLRSRMD
jgi:hypothetical protein